MGTFQKMIVMTALSMLALVTFTVTAPERTVVAAAESPVSPNLTDLFMYMRDSTGLSPEPPEDSMTKMTATIPNGYVGDGPLHKGVITRIGHTEWREVGTWYTDPVKNTINLGGDVVITMYVQGNPGMGMVTSDFVFSISRAGESTPILQMDITGVRIPAGTDDPAVFQVNDRFPETNDTTIQAGTAMSLNIQARCNGGGTLVYGSDSYKSGFTFAANALVPWGTPFISTEGAGLEYKDAFLVPWLKLSRKMIVNNVPLDNSQQTTEINSANQTRVLFWPTSFGPGNYEIVCSLCYDINGWGNVSATNLVKITVKTEVFYKAAWSWFKSNTFYFLLGAIFISLIVFIRVQRKKLWRRRLRTLTREEQALSARLQKKAWKKRNEKDLKLRREARTERRRQMEEEQAEKGFTLFKKKEPRAPKAPRARRAPVEVVTVSDSKKLTLDDIKELDLDL